eukprot:TRINITY_DN54639_c0_g1_i1.p1 TRINITY_DN54639_c0_g1~~TRINITY_DN54639_c0_g1_i1.p1  ORF type:complete len:121 (+),score=30.05 TRINITY_DN54639_c0_g1_i1:56-418(+)
MAKRKHDNIGYLAVIGDEDTVTGFLLTGIGNSDHSRKTNFLIVDPQTPKMDIETAFKDYTNRPDIAIIIINQNIADDIRHLLNEYNQLVPTVLEIPSKDTPYDPKKDTIFARVTGLLGAD